MHLEINSFTRNALALPCLVLSLGDIYDTLNRFKATCHWDDIFFAMKVSPSIELLKLYKQENLSFDVASEFEIETLLQLGVAGDRMILANPVKTIKAVELLFSARIKACSIDSLDELDKIIGVRASLGSEWQPEVLIRMKVESHDVEIDLNDKFGCSRESALKIITAAHENRLPITGLCFHVGSQSYLIDNYERAIDECLEFLVEVPVEYRQGISIIDIGGGFPSTKVLGRVGQSPEDFYGALSRICTKVKERGFRLWVEPGRALATNGIGVLSEVIGVSHKGGTNWLFLSEGKYGAYSGKYQDFQDFEFFSYRTSGDFSKQKMSWTISGPTCDSTDIVASGITLPADLKRGDLIFSPNIGAYSYAFACPFNGFSLKTTHIIP